MAIEVIVDGPPGGERRVAGDAVRMVGGGVLVVAGLVASVPVLVLVAYAMYSQAESGGVFADASAGDRAWLARILVLAVLLTAVGLPVGVRLLRGRRGLVLFLRRFGYTEATKVVTHAAQSVGRQWRLVTLDDEEVAPVGAGLAARSLDLVDRGSAGARHGLRLVGKGFTAVQVACLAGIVLGLLMLRPQAADIPRLLLDPGTSGEALVRALAVVLAVTLAVRVVVAVLGMLGLPLMVPMMFLGSTADAVRAADNAKTATIRGQVSLDLTARTIGSYGRKLFAPRLIVLRVETAIWQATVSRFASQASAVLIDISDPTDNLLWEIEHVLGRPGRRCVFICHLHRLPELLDEAAVTPTVWRLRALLDGRQVLAYVGDPAGVHRFSRALHGILADRSRG